MKSQKTSSKPQTRRLALAVVGGLLVIAAVIAMAIALRSDERTAKDIETTGRPPAAVPATSPSSSGGPLEVSVATDKQTYRHGETAVFSSKVRNSSDVPQSFTFNTTCTQGTLHIDGRRTQADRICGQAITDVVLQPGESKAYTYKFTLVKKLANKTPADVIDYDGELALPVGTHQAYLDWKGSESARIAFKVSE